LRVIEGIPGWSIITFSYYSISKINDRVSTISTFAAKMIIEKKQRIPSSMDARRQRPVAR
jgi:hypothetical protein